MMIIISILKMRKLRHREAKCIVWRPHSWCMAEPNLGLGHLTPESVLQFWHKTVLSPFFLQIHVLPFSLFCTPGGWAVWALSTSSFALWVLGAIMEVKLQSKPQVCWGCIPQLKTTAPVGWFLLQFPKPSPLLVPGQLLLTPRCFTIPCWFL